MRWEEDISAPLKFSDVEREIIHLLIEDKTHGEIADILDLPLETVEEHLNSLYSKLHISPFTSSALKERLWLGASTFCPRDLSPREWDVAKLIAQGKTTSEISEVLGIAEGTVIEYRKRLYDKLEMRGNVRDKGAVSTWVMEELILRLFNRELARHLLTRASQGILPPFIPDIQASEAGTFSVPRVICGRDEVATYAQELLYLAAQRAPTAPILLTCRSKEELWPRWKEGIGAALAGGWDVIQLWSLEESEIQDLNLVTDLLSLLGLPGRYEPHYFQGSRREPYDLIVVPGCGAMLTITDSSSMNTGFALPNEDCQGALSRHFWHLHGATRPLLVTYSPSDRVGGRYLNDLMEAEMKDGDLFLARKRGLSTLTLPESLYEAMLVRAIAKDKTGRVEERAQVIFDSFKKRKGAFMEQVSRRSFRNISSKRAVRRMVQEGFFADDTWMVAYYNIREEPQERRMHLEATIDLLERFEGYELALVDEDEEELITNSLWEVKGNEGVFIQTWYRELISGENVEMVLKLTEPSVIRAFSEYFLTIWEQIAFENRDKRQVIGWLKGQLDQIP